MRGKIFFTVVIFFLMWFCLSCSQSPQESAPNPASQTPPAPVVESKSYDISKDDITKIPDLTSQNISVEGVKLGDSTRDAEKILGKPLKMETTSELYRCAYRSYGLYLDINRFTGKVVGIYINSNYGKKATGGLFDLLSQGKLDLLKKAFGEGYEESQPETKVTMYAYPAKGIQFLQIKEEGINQYNLKLVPVKK